MNLPETIYAHAKALPAELQREALDFIEYLEQRYQVKPPATVDADTEAFIARFAGCMGADFPDDIDDADLGVDTPRESLE
jgi:hypothetical protein